MPCNIKLMKAWSWLATFTNLQSQNSEGDISRKTVTAQVWIWRQNNNDKENYNLSQEDKDKYIDNDKYNYNERGVAIFARRTLTMTKTNTITNIMTNTNTNTIFGRRTLIGFWLRLVCHQRNSLNWSRRRRRSKSLAKYTRCFETEEIKVTIK